MPLYNQSINTSMISMSKAGVSFEWGKRTGKYLMPLTCHQIPPWTRSVFQAAAHPVGMDNLFPALLYPDRRKHASLNLYVTLSDQVVKLWKTPQKQLKIKQLWTIAHLSNHINEQPQGNRIMNQGVRVERTEVFSWTELIVHCTKIRSNSVAMFNSANSEWKRATCNK